MNSYDRLQLVRNDRIKTYGMSLSSNSNSNSAYYNLVVGYIVFLILLLMVYML